MLLAACCVLSQQGRMLCAKGDEPAVWKSLLPDVASSQLSQMHAIITSSNSSTQELNHHWKLKELKIQLKVEKKGIISIPSSGTELCTGAGAAGILLLRLRAWLCAVQRTKSKAFSCAAPKVPSCARAGSASPCKQFLCTEIPLPPASTCLPSAPARASPLQKEQITAKIIEKVI